MSKRTIADAPGVELIERDLPGMVVDGDEVTETQLELMVGDWIFEVQYLTRAGMERMIERIVELHDSLDVARAKVFEMWQGKES